MTAIAGAAAPRDMEELRAELTELDEGLRSSDGKLLLQLAVVVLVCTCIIAPYRSVQLPRELMFAVGLCVVMLCMPMVLQGHDRLVLILLTYMPFSKAVPGTFGQLVRTFNATNMLLMLIVIGWAVYHGMNQRPLYRREKLDPYLGMFLFLALISLIQGYVVTERQEPLEAIFAMKRWITPMLLYFIITNNLTTVRHGLLIVCTIIVTTAIIGFLGLKEFYFDIGQRSSMEKSRISVTSGPNHMGFLFCSYIFFAIAMWWVYRKDRRVWLLWIPILACLQSMRLTFSRGAQVGLLAGIFYFVFLVNRKAFVILCALGVFVFFHPEVVPESLAGRLSDTYVKRDESSGKTLDKSANERVLIWNGAFKMIKRFPVLGVGYHNFPAYIGAFVPEMSWRDAHNTYFIVACEMGVPALIFFLMVLYMGWRSAKYVFDHCGDDKIMRLASLGYLSMFAASAVSNFFGSRFDSAEVTVQFYAATAVVVCFERILRLRLELAANTPPPVELPPLFRENPFVGGTPR